METRELMSPLDLETSSLDFNRGTILGVGLRNTFHKNPPKITGPVTCQNGRFEIRWLKKAGIEIDWAFDTLLAASVLLDRPADLDLGTLASYYLGQKDWKADTNKLFKQKNWVQKLQADPALYRTLAKRNLADLRATEKLTAVLQKKLEDENMSEFFHEKLMPAARLMAEVEYRGMRIDVPATNQKLVEINQKLVDLERELDKWADLPLTYQHSTKEIETITGEYTREEWDKEIAEWKKFDLSEGYKEGRISYSEFDEKAPQKKIRLEIVPVYKTIEKLNWNSPAQLSVLLKSKGYNLWNYDFKTRGMKESTGSDALERLLPNPHIEKLLEYRGAQKLKGYLESWLEENFEGRLHAGFNLASTRTGRLSSSGPNLQQVPRDPEIRKLFIPTSGKKFVILDASQVEPRFAAHFSKDEALLNVFSNSEDFYGSIAVRVLGVDCAPNDVKKKYPNMRKVAKEIGLSILYGIGANKLISIIKKKTGIIFTESQGRKIIKDYYNAYPGLLAFRTYVMDKIEREEILRTPYGRQFRINKDKAFSTGINTIIQSTASDYCLFSQLEIEKRLKELNIEAPLIALVHDECLREVAPEHAQIVGEIMEDVMTKNLPFYCPLEVEWTVADSWAGKS